MQDNPALTAVTAALAVPPAAPDTATVPLASGGVGLRGEVVGIDARERNGQPAPELERILLEIGFIEGARVEILHEGPFGRDPIAVRVDDMRVALRRHEARAVLVRCVAKGASWQESGNE